MVTRIGWAVVIVGYLLVASAEAQIWDGGGAAGGSLNWTTGTNWVGDFVPINNGTANITMAGTIDVVNTVDVSFDINSLTFDATAGPFVINNSGGATLTVRSGGITNQDIQTQTINAPLILGAGQTWSALAGALTIGGTVNLGTNQLTVSGAPTITINGVIQNTTGTIVKNSTGILDLTANNLFSGGLTLNAGTLTVSNNGAVGTGVLTLNGGTIQAGISAKTLANAVTIDGSFATGGPFDLSFSGAVTLTDAAAITINNSATQFSGAIGEIFPGLFIVKNGTGTLTFSGGSANTYTGNTTVNAGTLLLSKTAGVNAIAGNVVTAGDGIGGVDGDVLRLGASDQIVNGAGVTVNSSGLFDLSGFSETISSLVFDGGNVTTGTGTLTVNGSISALATMGGAADFVGNLNLGGGIRIFNIVDGMPTADLDVNGIIANGSITKTGAGTLWFSGGSANTYIGTTTVNDGTLVLAKMGSNGTILGDLIIGDGMGTGTDQVNIVAASQIANTANVTINDGAELVVSAEEDGFGLLTLNGGDVTLASGGVLTLTNNVVVNPTTATVFISAGLDSWVSLNGARTFTVADAAPAVEFEINTIVLNGTLVKEGLGTMRLSGAQDNTIGATINAGTLIAGKLAGREAIAGNVVIGDGLGGADADVLQLEGSEQIAQSVSDTVTVNSSGLFDLNIQSETIGNLVLNGGHVGTGTLIPLGDVTVNASAQTALIESTIDLAGATTDFTVADGAAAIDLRISGAITDGTLKITGAGTTRLTSIADNTVAINAGGNTLLLANTTGVAVAGILDVGDGVGGPLADIVRLEANDQLADTAIAVSVQNSGLLELNGFSDTVGALYFGGGSITTGAGTLTLANFVEAFANPQTASITGNINLGTAPCTFTVEDGAQAIDLQVSGTITAGIGGQLIKTGAGTLQLNTTASLNMPVVLDQGTLVNLGVGAAGSFTQNAGTFDGTLTNQGTFTFNGGSFPGHLINEGASTLGAHFTAGNGIENFGNLTVSSGQSVTANGAGLDNLGTLTLTGGTIGGSGPLINEFGANLIARGTIANAFTNNGTMTLTGVLTLTGAATNYGSISVVGSAGQSLRSDGGMTNSGLISLSGGGIGGAGTLTNSNSGTIQGSGGISIPVTNDGGIIKTIASSTLVLSNFSGGNINGGHVEIADNSQLTSPTAFSSGGTIVLKGANSLLTGGAIANTGTISGLGRVSNSIANSGTIRAEAGQLNLSGASPTNTASGQIQAATGAAIFYTQGLAANAGVIALTGGSFDNNSRPMTNTNSITGFGLIRTGGLTNTNLLSVGAGDMDVFGNVTNNGTVNVQAGRTLFFHNSVDGSGNYTGTGTVVYLGSFSPGASPASVSFEGNVDLTGSASLVMELGGLTPGTQHDQIHVAAQLSLDSALQVSLTGGFSPSPGNAFDILDWGALAGNFSSLELPTLGGTLTWDTSQLYTSGVLSIGSSVNLPGDYNSDGSVGVADYVIWRKNNGTNNTLANDLIGGMIGPAHYDQWRDHFGETAGAGGSPALSTAAESPVSTDGVPEPASVVLLYLGLVGLGTVVRSR
ncbi:MAG: autotransporter-associated beta strand repeat-containing protein [Planctomycetes bacterium]|nr:autotransporter-associated beta strand repeat-containing protein [Planctomycetota bacterium]